MPTLSHGRLDLNLSAGLGFLSNVLDLVSGNVSLAVDLVMRVLMHP